MSAADPLKLAPGVRRLRPDDHFMILSETDASPMHVGALILLDVPDERRDGVAAAIRRQFAERLPATPLLVRLHEAPDGYDSDVWADIAGADLESLIAVEPHDGAWSEAELYAAVARLNMRRLDLSGPPFAVHVLERLADGGSAFYLKMHHSVADGIGFQTVMHLLSDATPVATARFTDARLPEPEKWRERADARFAADAELRAAQSARRKEALAALEAHKGDREPTPEFALSGPTSAARRYATISLPLARVKAAGKALGATINDIFLTLASSALRNYLLETGDLPDAPLVVNSARSYRCDPNMAISATASSHFTRISPRISRVPSNGCVRSRPRWPPKCGVPVMTRPCSTPPKSRSARATAAPPSPIAWRAASGSSPAI